jgi:hypothetical protein
MLAISLLDVYLCLFLLMNISNTNRKVSIPAISTRIADIYRAILSLKGPHVANRYKEAVMTESTNRTTKPLKIIEFL